MDQFLQKRDWKDTPVAFDFNMAVSKAYAVDGIPYTVVVGKDGNIAWVHTGYSAEFKEQLAGAVAAALEAQ